MIVLILRRFRDVETGQIREVGQHVEMGEARARSLAASRHVEISEASGTPEVNHVKKDESAGHIHKVERSARRGKKSRNDVQ